MKKVLITGSEGYLGRCLVEDLLKNTDNQIIGIDIKDGASITDSRYQYIKFDVQQSEEEWIRLLHSIAPDSVFHLAFVVGEHPNKKMVKRVAVEGTMKVVHACNLTPSVKQLILSSSVSAYGAYKDNSMYTGEDLPLRAKTLQYGRMKKLMEEAVMGYVKRNRPRFSIAILRICTIVGPSERGAGTISSIKKSPVGVLIRKAPCLVQVVHEKDVLRACRSVLSHPGANGIYNICADDHMSLKQVYSALNKKVVLTLPLFVLKLMFWILSVFRFKGFSAGAANYIAYPIVVSNKRFKKAFDFEFEYKCLPAFEECAEALEKRNS